MTTNNETFFQNTSHSTPLTIQDDIARQNGNVGCIIILQNEKKSNYNNDSFNSNNGTSTNDINFVFPEILAYNIDSKTSYGQNCQTQFEITKKESNAVASPLPIEKNLVFSPIDRCNQDLLLGKQKSNAVASTTRKFECKECKKGFNDRHNLSHHMRYHRNDRRFKCETCEKAFFQKIHLIEHTRIHTGEKPHVCFVCNRRFRHFTNLKRHVRSIHLNEHFECSSCAQLFKRKATLKRHILKMHPESQDKCSN